MPSKLLQMLVVDDYGTIKLPGAFGNRIKSLELVGDPQNIQKVGGIDEGVALSRVAPPGANAYIIGQISDPKRKRGTDVWTREYQVQFYKIELK